MVARISNVERKRALRTFKQRGFVVQVGALEQLYAVFDNQYEGDFTAFLERTMELLSGPDGSDNGIFTKQLAVSIGERIKRDSDRKEGVKRSSVDIISTLSVPRWRPHAVATMQSGAAGKRIETPRKAIINAPAKSKGEMFRARYELILSKTLRNPKFKPPVAGSFSLSSSSPYYHLTGIESLSGRKGDQLVLGLLTQLEEGSWYLEDLNGTIKVDLSEACITSGMHTEGSFVIAQGQIIEHRDEEPLFKVHAMGTPPHESREDSIIALGRDANLFGGEFDMNEALNLVKVEEQSLDTTFLFFSDVALDNSRVLAGLRHIWKGFLEDGVVPSVIILMGSFLSHPFGQKPNDVSTLCDKFGELGSMIKNEFEQLIEETTFVIIPGANDPGPGNVLPRPPMPQMITKQFVEVVGSESVHFATNPCRIRFITQEIVILRDDLMQKMIRHCAVKPDLAEAGLMHTHLVKTVSDQSYLTPLPLSARPILWAHDHALWLFPNPHVLVLADRVDSYICTYENNLGMNPGSFKTDFSFLVYLPAEKRAQQSSLDSEQFQSPEQSYDRKQEGDEVPNAQSDDQSISDDAQDAMLADEEEDLSADVELPDSDQAVGGSRNDQVSSNPVPSQTVPTDAPHTDDIRQNEDELHSEENVRSTDEGSERPMKSTEESMPIEPNEENIAIQESPRSRDSDDDEEESDDDSYLAPAEGLKRLDIKALVRSSMMDESKPMPASEDDID
ncbi:DNA polymerase epsilon subunit 2 [Gracilariopsis chorda]|uniref:DNA polymerase II subunit 2 n=1 Tax=Gracilariopsis chorda TaxID=448386 RepID=A0A2V3IME2_9FLOR|nr:DNA polymerase epsilon subunit 2 [Gracilariopsis chorda]|eukprot:PXF42280.1 DNA polymerase epsilon subunit 2 [Gracilariopsis chorda]